MMLHRTFERLIDAFRPADGPPPHPTRGAARPARAPPPRDRREPRGAGGLEMGSADAARP